MVIALCLNNLVLSEGLKAVITRQLASAHVFNPRFDPGAANPDIVLFLNSEGLVGLKQDFAGARLICLDLGLSESELACLLYYHGIHGIISPGLEAKMFCKALLAIHAGEVWVEQSHLKIMLNAKRSPPKGQSLHELRAQDRRIIHLVATGLKNQEIADSLCLSESTIKSHLSRIYRTLNLSNRAALAALAIESGCLDT